MPSESPFSFRDGCIVAALALSAIGALDYLSSLSAEAGPKTPIGEVDLSVDDSAKSMDSGESEEADRPIKPAKPTAPPKAYATPVEQRGQTFDAWRATSEDWAIMDFSIRACTRMKFVNGFYGTEPEDAIDACLAQAEREDAERKERNANRAAMTEDFE